MGERLAESFPIRDGPVTPAALAIWILAVERLFLSGLGREARNSERVIPFGCLSAARPAVRSDGFGIPADGSVPSSGFINENCTLSTRNLRPSAVVVHSFATGTSSSRLMP